MTAGRYGDVTTALNDAGVRFVVVGGYAVLVHAGSRLTYDLDLVIDLAPDAALAAMRALVGVGLVPRVPVNAEDFADPEQRMAWMRDKNMTVFSMLDPQDPLRIVDLFVEEPIGFEQLYADSVVAALDRVDVHVASVAHLIEMKRAAGRLKDLADVEALEAFYSPDSA